MGTQTQTFRSVSGQALSHNIVNKISPVTTDTEFSQTITEGTQQLLIRCRGSATIKFTFVSGESGTKYITIRRGTVYSAANLNLLGKTLYMQVDKASQVIEIEEWY